MNATQFDTQLSFERSENIFIILNKSWMKCIGDLLQFPYKQLTLNICAFNFRLPHIKNNI